MNPEKVCNHYGYIYDKKAGHAEGFWKKESVPENIRKLSGALSGCLDYDKKIQVIFEYDPDFPRAYLKISGLKDVNNSEAGSRSL
ncbi:MAG: hypothetical protein K2K35_11310 [Lachnospiraceae bacterium]|nr:hypothetical protein [Lachnospiraceae bacterium]